MYLILTPIAALALNVIVQVSALRGRRGTQFFRSIVEGFFAGALLLAILQIAFVPRGGFSIDFLVLIFLVNLPIYLALSYCAYNFIQLGQTSIRIRLYSEIAATPSGISAAEIQKEYDDTALMRARLRRLVESGDIIEKGGRFFIGRSRFLLVSHILFAAKRILLGRESEFHDSGRTAE